MKKYIIYIVMYGIAILIIAAISTMHEMTTSELFMLMIIIMMGEGIGTAKETEKQNEKIKMLEARIDALRNEVRQHNENQKYI